MIKIEITDTNVETFDGVSKRTGQPFQIRRQRAYWHQGGPYPQPFDLTLENGQMPYQPGTYTLDPSSIVMGKYGLELRPRLKQAEIRKAS